MKPTKNTAQKQAPTLPTLARRANREHAACEKAIRSALEHARQCGQFLIQAKALVAHGNFQDWIAKNCKFSPQMARRYMALARGWARDLEQEAVAKEGANQED